MFLIALLSCKKLPDCPLMYAPTRIENIKFLSEIELNTDIPIYVTASLIPSACNQEVRAKIEPYGKDTFLIKAEMGILPLDSDCPCLIDYFHNGSIVYFKSSKKGKFVFIYEGSDISSVSIDNYVEIEVK